VAIPKPETTVLEKLLDDIRSGESPRTAPWCVRAVWGRLNGIVEYKYTFTHGTFEIARGFDALSNPVVAGIELRFPPH
jgi:hypothetical protein